MNRHEILSDETSSVGANIWRNLQRPLRCKFLDPEISKLYGK